MQGQTSTAGKKKAPIGAIVGGVVGGVAVLVIGGTLAFLFLRKHNRNQTREDGVRPYISRPQIHGRSVSDVSGKSILLPQSMSAVYSYRPATVYTTGTTHTHNGSVHSLSYASGYTSPVGAMSPPLPAQVLHREDVIEPFTLRPTSPPVSMPAAMGRKASESTLRSASNHPDSPTAALVQDRNAAESSDRARLNPPAYSPYASPASSPEPTEPIPLPQSPGRREFAPGHRTRREKASVDTQVSYDSNTSHGGGESISAIDEVVGRMGLTMAPESVMGSNTVSTGQSATVGTRPTHKPSVSNPDNDTLG